AGIIVDEDGAEGSEIDVLVVDVTQLRGDPLARLRSLRAGGEKAPAIVMAAHFPPSRLRDLFHLGVGDILLKPYRPVELCKAVFELSEARASEVASQILARRLQSTRQLLERRSEEIRLLSEIGRSVASLADLDLILMRVVEAAAFLTEAEEASIYLADSESDEVVLRASKQAGDRHGTLPSLKVTDTMAGHVYRTGQPVLRQSTFDGGAVKVQTGFLVQSLIKVPVRMHREVVGVLGVYNRLSSQTFDEHHLSLLLALATWVGVALERATLLNEIQIRSLSDQTSEADTLVAAPDLEDALGELKRLLKDEYGPLSSSMVQNLARLRTNLESMISPPLAPLSDRAGSGLVHLSATALEVAAALTAQAVRKGVELIVEPGVAMPPIQAEQQKAYRVVEALAASALDRTPRGRILLKPRMLEIRNGRSLGGRLPKDLKLHDGKWAAVTVSDPSRALSADSKRALTSETADPSAGDMGQGISMGQARAIAESMGGVLWFEQSLTGTSLTFALPVDREESST
ncbi:MAG: GAF domain-containing protein, partial [Anaerolineales bacterium]